MLLVSTRNTFAQSGPCDSSVPIYIVNLESNASGTWSVPGIFRDGSCCSYSSPPISCVKFIVTLNEDAEGIIFNVTDGALPQSLTWQLMNPAGDYCEPTQYPANVPVCLNGQGPHTIIFCKPGGNNNTYTISSVAAPGASGNLIVNDGCTGIMNAYGYDPATIQWTSVYPGTQGQYNNYLSCTTCETVTVTGQVGLPAYVDYEVCGLPFGSCNPEVICDTVRVTFNTTLFVNILPEQPTVCYGGTNTSIYAQGIGGSPPYTYTWSNGQVTTNIDVGVGTYIVTVSDISGCPPNYDTVTVTEFTSEILANAGSDIDVCSYAFPANLSGYVQAASGGVWTGGTGSFSPSNTSLQTSYTPSAAEIFVGYANLNLITTGNGTCPADTDDIKINIHNFNANIASSTNVSCSNGDDGSASVNLSQGTSPFIYLWSNGEYSNPAINLEAGTNYVTVSDSYNCQSVLTVTITQPTALTATDTTESANCGGNQGSATILPSGGTPPYSYLWQNGETTQTILNITHGVYSVTVTDSKLCQEEFSVYVDDLSPPFVDITSSTNNLCYGNTNGSATVTITTPGVGAHTYYWSTTPPQTTATANNLPAGTYTVVVTDEIGCTGTDVVTITQPNDLDIAFINQNINCFGGSNGSINTTVTGGIFPYSYNWSTGSTNNFLNNITAGTYILTVTDNNSCTHVESTTITQPPKLTFSQINITNVKCHGRNTGSISVTVQGGVYPYSYNWSTGQTSSIISNLYAGTYLLTITGSNGCTLDTILTVTHPDTLNISYIASPANCYQQSSGEIDATVSGGIPPYIYFWSNGSVTEDVSGLLAGSYNLMIRDANNCSYIETMTITEPDAITLSLFRQNVTCNGYSDGLASVTPSGGTPNYTYLWSNGGTQFNNSNLNAGTYNVSVTDNNGCVLDTVIEILEPQPIQIDIQSTNVSCYGLNNGAVDITMNGGIYPYDFLWSTGATTEDISSLNPGGYFLQVTDYNGCNEVANVVITQPQQLNLSINPTAAKCYLSADGSANLTVSGGTTPYSFNWSNGQITEDLTNASAGNYTAIVTDNNGCQNQINTTITQPDSIHLSVTITDVSCFNGSDGKISIVPTGGTSPYAYLWNNAATQANIINLISGTYIVTVTDNNGCIKIKTINISQPSAIDITFNNTNASCFGKSDGSSVASVVGGVSPYTYLWTTGGTNNSISNIPAGTYVLSVTDNNSCVYSESTTITQPSQLYFSATQIVNIKCHGKNTGSISVEAQGGTLPYTYLWSNALNTQFISGLYAGSYTVTITEANNCFIDTTIVLTQPDTLNASYVSTSVSCYGGSDGSLNATVSGGVTPYTFLWSNSATTEDISGLSIGNYNLSVNDANNCTFIQPMSVSQPTKLIATLSSINVSCNGYSDGQASISASGGTPNYTYNWSTGSSSNSINTLISGTYYVTVTDNKNCTLDTSILITQPQILDLNYIAKDVSCYGENDGEIDLIVNGGTNPYTFLWSTGATSEDLTLLSPAGYYVEVIDSKGCDVYGSFVINEPDSLYAISSAIPAKCYGGSDGIINLNVIGGTSPYSYIWSNGNVSKDITGLSVGSYIATISDFNGCTYQISSAITGPDSIHLSFNVTNLTCFESGDGKITVTATGGSPGYTYLWDANANSQTNYTAYNLQQGSYTVTVTDSQNCPKQGSAFVSQPIEITVTTSENDTICPGFDATISAIASGSSNYTYSWSNGLGAGSSKVVKPTVTTTYYVTATDGNQCNSKPDSATVFVRNLYPDSLSVSTAGGVCKGQFTTVQGSYSDEFGGYQLTWSNNLGTGEGPFSVSPDTTTTYYLTVTNICNNSISESVTVEIYEYPVISISGLIAEGCEPLTVTFKDSTLPSTYTYTWDFGNGEISYLQSPSYTYENDGNYQVSLNVVSDHNCPTSSSKIMYVTVFDNPVPQITYNPSVVDIRHPVYDFSIISPIITDVTWFFGDNDSSNVFTPSHTYRDTGSYTVTAYTTNENGCKNSNYINVVVDPYFGFTIPNAFSPNLNGPNGGYYNIDDPNNDIFFPIAHFVKTFKFSIFNRWGELIFESLDVNIGWDGYYKGKLCKQDVYIWKLEIEYTNGQSDKLAGHVTLIR